MQNILESQVSDLAHLANSSIAIGAAYDMNGQRQMSSAESPARENGKRKNDNAQGGGQPRAKRNRYISIACNECKRRKIKCNGNTPCQRCGNLNLECQYAPNCCANGFKDSEEFRQMNAQISSLQEQVNDLYANMNALRGGDPMAGQHGDRSMSIHSMTNESPNMQYRSMPPRFQGPTSSAFSINVAKNTLQNMGYPGLADGLESGLETQDATPMASPPTRALAPPHNSNRDPLFSIRKDEAIRLCRIYDEEMGIMYPVVSIESVIAHAESLYRYLEAASEAGPMPGGSDDSLNILRMVMACALITEGAGESALAVRLYEAVKIAAAEILQGEVVEIKSLPLLAIVAMFHFHCDNESAAWRVIGQAARLCIELGLHRRDALCKNIPDEEDRSRAVKIFWSIYVLDRRWSFGTGMPFVLQDADIDPNLPEPELTGLQYLNVMIAYSRIGSRVWRSVADSAAIGDFKKEETGYLDYQVGQWQKSIPQDLQLPTANAPESAPTRAIHRLQILLYLRANQMRILIYRPVLHSANSIMENLSDAQTVIELAKDTIVALTHLNQTTDIYRVQQVCFNYFLISALAVIFLASCHAPVQFSSVCRDEFYMALDLIKGFSSRSYISKRLWRTIRGLKEAGPKLGLSPEATTNQNAEDPHSSAALAMAGLAGHEITGMSGFMGGQQDSRTMMGNSPMNGFQMSHEMTNLFEAALGSANVMGNGHQYPVLTEGAQGDASQGSNAFGGEEELYRQLRHLF